MATDNASKEISAAINSLGPLAKTVNKTAGGLWSIFVRRYLAIGAGELFAAAALVAVCLWLMPYKSPMLIVPFVIAIALVFDAIVNLMNPHYRAVGQVIVHVKQATKSPKVEVTLGYPRG